jgi:probable rRNA maturation factor
MSRSVNPLNRSIVKSAKFAADVTMERFNDSTIIIVNRQRARKINSRWLKKITEALLADLKIREAELGINLVAAREMTLINETFLQHEGSTDVITFDHSDSVGDDVRSLKKKKSEPPHLGPHNCLYGEIFICVDEAVLQAGKFKTTWPSEIVRYLVHGVLHLLGHDDGHAAARRRMKREENRLLHELSKKFSLAQTGGASKLRA